MRLKDNSIRVMGMRPELFFPLTIANEVYTERGLKFVVTSLLDGKHSEKSLHYAGCAFDCRIYDHVDNNEIKKEIKDRLNIHFDVVLEKDHIHVEFQPRI